MFVRHFSQSHRAFKGSKKDALRSLGATLHKGKVQSEKEPETSEIQKAYDSVSHMTTEDVQIQANLDQGKQFQSFPSEHFLDRKRILRGIPDEIDIFNTSDDEIRRIYDNLDKLDKDKSVQFKYYKRYLKQYSDPFSHIIQEFNGIDSKFRMLRRREVDSLMLSPGLFIFRDNLLSHPYNVVGFDRSILGLPLRTGKQLVQKCYPQEFIEDLQMFRKKIPVHKRDLDFIEAEEAVSNVDPSRLAQRGESDIDAVLNDINHRITATRSTFAVHAIDDYQPIPITQSLQSRIVSEILAMKLQLQQEIETAMTAGGPRLLLFSQDDIRTSFFKLCQSTSYRPTEASGIVVVKYLVRDLSILPPFFFTMNSVRQKGRLQRHLMKLFFLNLEDQIDTLMRIKYDTNSDMARFMKKLSNKVRKVVNSGLADIATKKDLPVDAVVYRPILNRPFKRILWCSSSVRRLLASKHKSNYRLALGTLE